ncbi:MAG: dienelactone hydrolase family protein [Chitinophagales bacterium]|nr:dienelactone hydrolase family protein [Chitinophagales bacterium]
MKIEKNIVVPYLQNNIRADVYFKEQNKGKLLLFLHGFKGFKDWGAWHLVAQKFAEEGYIFVKFNFSHNGIGQDNFQEFTRLDLFAQNNYTKELDNVKTVLNWIEKDKFWNDINVKDISIIGHSRGGGIALQSAFEDRRIDKVITWASICDFNRFGTAENIQNWKEQGYKNFYNGRTKQDMKIGFQFYEDYENNKAKLDIENAVKKLNKPQLIIHGTADEAVGFSHAQRLKNWNAKAELHLIENANHVFGAKHPYADNHLPKDLGEVVKISLGWLYNLS